MATIPEALAIALQHHQAGRLQAAEQIYRQILALQPNHADAWHLLGVINAQTGNHQLAVDYIYRALRLKPDWAEARNSLGNALKDQGKLEEAVACYRRALELKPDFAQAQNNLGIALRDQGKLDEAVECWRRTLKLKPDYAEAHSNLGNALRDQGKLDEAIACYHQALEVEPDYVEAHNNLGAALQAQGKLDEAITCYRRALEPKPDSAEAQTNLGAALQAQGKLDEAITCYRRTLELKPDFAQARINLGAALQAQGKLDEAMACYRRTLELKPDLAEAHWNQSLLSLLTGDFQRGWAKYEWRWKTKQFQQRDFSQALWDGQVLEGRAILLHAEQGLGDTIQFVRYAALVKQRGGAVIVECPKPLVSLLTSFAGIDRLVGQGEEIPAFDFQAPLLSLPGIFHTVLRDIPAAIPYLFADADLVEHWRRELGGIAGFKVGIAWRGSPAHVNDRARSLPLSCFETLASLPDIHLLSLQKGAGAEELQEARNHFPVTEAGSRLENFADTAALMMNLDLVITCDTAVAHLAGALGVPVWVALPLVPDWRWLLDRDDSPWYPTMRLFRQKKPRDWAGVFDQIKTVLVARLPC